MVSMARHSARSAVFMLVTTTPMFTSRSRAVITFFCFRMTLIFDWGFDDHLNSGLKGFRENYNGKPSTGTFCEYVQYGITKAQA